MKTTRSDSGGWSIDGEEEKDDEIKDKEEEDK